MTFFSFFLSFRAFSSMTLPSRLHEIATTIENM